VERGRNGELANGELAGGRTDGEQGNGPGDGEGRAGGRRRWRSAAPPRFLRPRHPFDAVRM